MTDTNIQSNQEALFDTTSDDTTSDTQQANKNEETDTFSQSEHGRSMVEMLGVLAVIGVLTIGGVQGYHYAMEKYHANEVVNELNILNAQLAVFMSGIHENDAVMSLGEPYDNAEKIKTGGYAFTYGCGLDPTTTAPCDLDETGYYMVISDVPEDVCKATSQMTANMMNLVEQRINDIADKTTASCHEGNNQLTFLFDTDNGEWIDDEEGEEDNDEELTQTYEPDETFPSDEESTQTVLTTTSVLPSMEGCQDNSHCQAGEYCYMQYGYSGTQEFSDETRYGQSYAHGTCRNALQDAKETVVTVGTNYKKLVSSNLSMTWWSAQRFCNVINGVRQASMDDVNQIPKNERYLLNQKLGDFNWWVTGGSYDYSDHKTWFYFNGLDLQISGYDRASTEHALCITNENVSGTTSDFHCTSNNDCASDEYCHTYSSNCNSLEPIGGECKKVSYKTYTIGNTTLYKSNDYISWWSVPNFCARVGGRMISMSDLGCYQPHSGYCSLNGKYDGGLSSFAKSVLDRVEHFWLNNQTSDSCYAYQTSWNDKTYTRLNSTLKDGSGGTAVCISGSGSNGGYNPEYTYSSYPEYTYSGYPEYTYLKTTPYQTATYVVTNPTHSSIWLGPNEVYSRTAAREYCENNGGVLAKVADVGCTNIVSSTCNITVNLHPHDWTIFEDYEASWASDIVYVQTGTSITTQYGTYPVCVPK